MIRVTIWNEYQHEQEYEGIRKVYPEGIHGAIREGLSGREDLVLRTATMYDEGQGLTEEILADTDVLIYWAHAAHDKITEENAERIARRVREGMGAIFLHSGHGCKAIAKLLGTTMTLKWKEGDRERLFTVNPTHPIAAGVPEIIELEREEMYGEFFDIPTPDDVVFEGWFASGYLFRSGVTFTRGKGKIFYFQPGHEEFPIYHRSDIRKILENAVYWAAPETCETLPRVIREERPVRENIHVTE